MASEKSDANIIRGFLDKLKEESFLRDGERKWWPDFLFHYTGILNALKILSGGYLFSRHYLISKGRTFADSGSREVLGNTDQDIMKFVRLYFRPLTPTQFHSEGVRSSEFLEKSKFPDAHCPFPVFFLFSSNEVLSKKHVEFSNGNLGRMGVQRYKTGRELMALPWKKIYHHSGSFGNDKSSIIFHRNAEVIVPNKLNLDSLRLIYCRSYAEKETLMHLLDSDLRDKYGRIITASTRRTLFNRRHTFIENVRLSPDLASFQFSPDTESPGPFNIRVTILDLAQGASHRWESSGGASGIIDVPIKEPISNYEVRLHLDNILVYANGFEVLDIPF